MKRRLGKHKNSGQTLIITALVISLLILSVVYGVFEAGRRSEIRSATNVNSYVLATKLGLRNTVTSALVNFSRGGENGVLSDNLNTYSEFLGNQSYFGKCLVFFTVYNTSPYQSGMWLSWGSNGTGVSSAYANCTLVFVNTGSETRLEYSINRTTRLEIEECTYTKLEGTSKQVNLTCRIFNEEKPALADNITIYYEDNGDPSDQNWIAGSSQTVTDYGNGTYQISFTTHTQTIDDPVLVSAHVWDQRGIFVAANNTCTET